MRSSASMLSPASSPQAQTCEIKLSLLKKNFKRFTPAVTSNITEALYDYKKITVLLFLLEVASFLHLKI